MNRANLAMACAMALTMALAGCEKAAYEPAQQSGANPPLPKPRSFFVPPMQVPKGTGWAQGEKPAVADGLEIEPIASGLMHPRQLLMLPNGDVLVVEANGPGDEPVSSPKQMIAGLVKNQSGKGGKGGNRITLLRRAPGQPGEWRKHLFIENLHSPFGVQLVGDTLYVANTDAIMKYRYTPGETRMSDPGVEFADLPGTINHHWTKALLASADGSRLYVGVGSNSNITENGLDVEYRRAVVLEVDARTGASRIYASGIRNPTGLGAGDRQALGHRQRARRDRRGPGARLPHLGAGGRFLRLALQLLRAARGYARAAAAPGPGGQGHPPRLRAGFARGAAGPVVLPR